MYIIGKSTTKINCKCAIFYVAMSLPEANPVPLSTSCRLTAYFSADPRDPRFVRLWRRMLRAETVKPTEGALQMALKVAVTGLSVQHAKIYGKYMENIWKYIWKIYGKYMGNMGNMGTCCLKFDGI